MDTIDACRTCLQSDDYMYSIYKPIALKNDTKPITPMDLFRMIPRLNIKESDKLPSNICSKCLDDTLSIYNFILKCERANRMLNKKQVEIKLEPEETNGLSTNDHATSTSIDFYSPRTSKSVECIPFFDLTSDSASECDFEVTPDIQEIDEPFQTGPSSSKNVTTIIIGDQSKVKIEKPDDNFEDIKPNISDIVFTNPFQTNSSNNVVEPMPLQEIKKEEVEIGEETIYAPHFFDPNAVKQEVQVVNQLQQVQIANVITIHVPQFMTETKPPKKIRKTKDLFVGKCNDCGQLFKTIREYDLHIESCLPLFECGICSEAFQDNDSVAIHFVTVHPGEKPIFNRTDVKAENSDAIFDVISECSFQCPSCPKSFATDRRLQGHMKVHSQRHVCVPCKKSFRTKHHLKCHLVRKHQDTWKKIICGVCDLRFACRADLLRHQLKHTKEKPYKCSECQNTYGYKKVLADHIRQNHDLSEEEIQKYLKEHYSKALVKYLSSRFTCYVCAAEVERDDLAAHMNSHKK